MSKTIHKQVGKAITLPIKWEIGDDIVTRFATNMVIQNVGSVFKISFFEAKPDIRLTVDTPIPSEVKADCVASIVVTPSTLAEFVKVLQQHMERHVSIGATTASERPS